MRMKAKGRDGAPEECPGQSRGESVYINLPERALCVLSQAPLALQVLNRHQDAEPVPNQPGNPMAFSLQEKELEPLGIQAKP